MLRSDHRTLLDKGRKAGLSTYDLYNALAGRRPQPHEQGLNATDGNGFVPTYDRVGHPVYRPGPGGNA
jgi:hypothetical protein